MGGRAFHALAASGLAFAATLQLAACDSGRWTAPTDTSGDAGGAPGDDSGVPPLRVPGLDLPAPRPPELPRLPACLQGDSPAGCAELPRLSDWPCPEGWLAEPIFIDAEGRDTPPAGLDPHTLCRPPEPAADCPDGVMAQLGSTQCVQIGDPCPDGDFPEVPDEVEGIRLYVVGGAEQGDGTRAAPFGTLRGALAAAPHGAVVVIGAGSFAGPYTVDRELTIWGACAERVSLYAPAGGEGTDIAAVVAKGAAHLKVRNVQLGGRWTGALVRGAKAVLTLEGVWVHQATYHGVLVDGGTLEMARCHVEGTRSDDLSQYGRGQALVRGGGGGAARPPRARPSSATASRRCSSGPSRPDRLPRSGSRTPCCATP